MNRKLVFSALVAAILAIGNAGAGTSPITFTVQVTVANACTIAVNTLDFGTQTSLAAAVSGSTTGTVTCTGNSPVTISMNTGSNGTTLGAVLKMKNGANLISYNLYTDAARTLVWGDGATGGTQTVTITPTGGSVAGPTFNVYGLIAAAQNPKPNGVYTDSVTATVTF
jgi:spore coat protein U-like protein